MDFLVQERARLEVLLAGALVIATAGTGCTPEGLLELLAEINYYDLAKAATPRRRLSWNRDREELLQLLRPTDPGPEPVDIAEPVLVGPLVAAELRRVALREPQEIDYRRAPRVRPRLQAGDAA